MGWLTRIHPRRKCRGQVGTVLDVPAPRHVRIVVGVHPAVTDIDERQQLLRCEVRAEVPGIVVYKEVFFGSEQRKPQVGDQVWANQPLIILPDISRVVVETKVRETDIHKVEKNQRVSIKVEAYPDLALTGEVTLVGTLA